MLITDINIELFKFLDILTQYNFYIYCKNNNLYKEENFILKYYEKLKKQNYKLDIEDLYVTNRKFILFYQDFIIFDYVYLYNFLNPDDFLLIKPEYLRWEIISYHYNFDINYLELYKDRILWSRYSIREHIPLNILQKFRKYICWDIVKVYNPTNEFVKQNKKYINWYNVIFDNIYTYLEHLDKPLNWDYICYSYMLNEDFIERAEKYVNWEYISSCQFENLSDNFIEKYQHKLNMRLITFFRKISK